jgi:hypothetical protein
MSQTAQKSDHSGVESDALHGGHMPSQQKQSWEVFAELASKEQGSDKLRLLIAQKQCSR